VTGTDVMVEWSSRKSSEGSEENLHSEGGAVGELKEG